MFFEADDEPVLGGWECSGVTPGDKNGIGAAWVFTRSGSVWSQQGAKLIGDCTQSCGSPEGTGEISRPANGGGYFAESVSLSGDGNTALIGAPVDNNAAGAAWVFTRSRSAWSQQGTKLVGDFARSYSGPKASVRPAVARSEWASACRALAMQP